MMNEAHPHNDITSNPKKRRAWVIYQLNVNGTSLAKLSRDNGFSRNAASKALDTNRKTAWPRMEAIIANALGTTAQKLFPERYDKSGLPIHASRGRPPVKENDRA